MENLVMGPVPSRFTELSGVHVEDLREFPGFTQQSYPDIPEDKLLGDYSL